MCIFMPNSIVIGQIIAETWRFFVSLCVCVYLYVCVCVCLVLCTCPRKYRVVDADGTIRPRCCIDMSVITWYLHTRAHVAHVNSIVNHTSQKTNSPYKIYIKHEKKRQKLLFAISVCKCVSHAVHSLCVTGKLWYILVLYWWWDGVTYEIEAFNMKWGYCDWHMTLLLLHPRTGVKYCDGRVCLSVCLYI